MHLPLVTSSPAPLASPDDGEPAVPVRVMLLGVRVTAYAIINIAEHRRRETAGLGAVINPAWLDRLMDLPIGIPVTDPVVWAEMADQPRGVVERHEDGVRITRRLESPLTITDVVVMGYRAGSCAPSRTPACSLVSRAAGLPLSLAGYRTRRCWRRSCAASASSIDVFGSCWRARSHEA